MVTALIALGVVGLIVVARTLNHQESVHSLVRAGERQRVQELIAKHPNQATALNREGEAPIHVAAKVGRLEMLEVLREGGANVNARTEEGVTPLHFAAAFNEIACVQWLLDNGAQLAARESSGLTPLSAAKARGHDELAKFLEGRVRADRFADDTLARWLERSEPVTTATESESPTIVPGGPMLWPKTFT